MNRGEIMRGLSMAMTLQNVIRVGGGGGGGDVIRNGLIVWYDGINNTGDGHSGDTAQWWDLSGNGNHGAIRGGTWGDDELICNGTSTWVNSGNHVFRAVTIECLMALDAFTATSSFWPVIAGNYQYGGYGFNHTHHTNFRMQVYKEGRYRQVDLGPQETGVYRMLGGSADSHMQRGYFDGQLSNELVYDAQISPPQNNTVFGLGGNSNGTVPAGDYFKGRIKSFRLYDRVLTPEEIAQNYNYDKQRFGL